MSKMEPIDKNKKPSRTRQKRWGSALHSVVSVFLALLLWYMVNYISSRHYVRVDISTAKDFVLSDTTSKLIKDLNDPMTLHLVARTEHDLYWPVRSVLKEYEAASRQVKLQYVDPVRDMEAVELLKQRIPTIEGDVVIAEHQGKASQVSLDKMAEYETAKKKEGEEKQARPSMVGFSAEHHISTAVYNVTQAKRPNVYFLEGHGEKSLEAFDQGRGYSSLAKLLDREHLAVQGLRLDRALKIPEDCDALVIPGASRRISQPEIDLIFEYLNNNGRVLLLLDALVDSGLEGALPDWGVKVGQDVVLDRGKTLSGRELFISSFGDHPITASLKQSSAVLYVPRSVSVVDGAADHPAQDRPRPTSLAFSSSNGWAEADTDVNPARFEADRDLKGPVSLGVAVERGVEQVDVSVPAARLVVFGDSDFLCNGLISGGSFELFLNSLNWLVDRDLEIDVPVRQLESLKLSLSKDELEQLFLWMVCILPSGAGVLGFMVWFRRRK